MRIELPRNLDDVKVTDGFPTLPEGEYKLRCLQVPEMREGDKGPFLLWTFEVIENPEYDKARVTHVTSITEKALQHDFGDGLKSVLQALGVPWEGRTFDDALCPGQEAIAYIVQRADKKDPDNIYSDIKKIYPVGADGVITD